MSGWWDGSERFGLLEPAWLLLALLAPLALLLRLRRGPPALPFAAAALAAGLPPSRAARLRWLPDGARVGALCLLAFALARPVERLPLPREVIGLDALLCLDLSSSMNARDLDPARTRLDVARAAAAQFITGRPQDRFGLLQFARYADLLAPPTLDHAAVNDFLEEARTVEPDGPEDRTGIGGAIARGARILKDSPSRSKVLILFTDGEENVAGPEAPTEITPMQATQLCAAWGVRLYVIAAGAGAAGEMRGAAERTGGGFFAARDAADLERAYARIGDLERSELSAPRFAQREWFWPFVCVALLGLFLARGFESSSRGWLP